MDDIFREKDHAIRHGLFGGLEEIRTPDPRNANAMRSQLRYEPLQFWGALELYRRTGCLSRFVLEVIWGGYMGKVVCFAAFPCCFRRDLTVEKW